MLHGTVRASCIYECTSLYILWVFFSIFFCLFVRTAAGADGAAVVVDVAVAPPKPNNMCCTWLNLSHRRNIILLPQVHVTIERVRLCASECVCDEGIAITHFDLDDCVCTAYECIKFRCPHFTWCHHPIHSHDEYSRQAIGHDRGHIIVVIIKVLNAVQQCKRMLTQHRLLVSLSLVSSCMPLINQSHSYFSARCVTACCLCRCARALSPHSLIKFHLFWILIPQFVCSCTVLFRLPLWLQALQIQRGSMPQCLQLSRSILMTNEPVYRRTERVTSAYLDPRKKKLSILIKVKIKHSVRFNSEFVCSQRARAPTSAREWCWMTVLTRHSMQQSNRQCFQCTTNKTTDKNYKIQKPNWRINDRRRQGDSAIRQHSRLWDRSFMEVQVLIINKRANDVNSFRKNWNKTN